MKNYKLKTKLLGEIEISAESGLYKHFNLTLTNQAMNTTIDIAEENVINDDTIELIQSIIDSLPTMYKISKQTILKQKNSNSLIQDFIKFHLDEIDTLHELFDINLNSKITEEMFIEKLSLRRFGIYRDAKENAIMCMLDMCISAEYSDELLVIYFNTNNEIINISHES